MLGLCFALGLVFGFGARVQILFWFMLELRVRLGLRWLG